MKKAILIWGNQLSEQHSALQQFNDAPVIMIESRAICSARKYHKQKLVFVLSAMRHFADNLTGRTVHYSRLEDAQDDYHQELKKVIEDNGFTELIVMRPPDRPPIVKLQQFCEQQDIALKVTENNQFLTSETDFEEWADGRKTLLMEHFYRWQRKRFDILMDGNDPEGGQWNFDKQNRKPLPKDIDVPSIRFPKATSHVNDCVALVESEFADHPGKLDELWLPVTQKQADSWLETFLDERFSLFGDYEDAMHTDHAFLYHSALSALLNIGLLHPRRVIDAALAKDAPINSKEGFIRQIIGWREYMFSMYRYKDPDWKDQNYLNNNEQMEDWWWFESEAPNVPLRHVLSRVEEYGYAHHIERLMVLGNYMLLRQYNPQAVYEWFMCMFVDAYEWVMVGNVIGMSQYADGGLDNGSFASKPYISGGNYLHKMSNFWETKQEAQDSVYTELYWDFLSEKRDLLEDNHRLAPMFSILDKRND